MSIDFGCILRKYLSDVDWLGLVKLGEMHYGSYFCNEFYSGILLKKSESNMIVHFNSENIYTFFDGRERELIPLYLGDLLFCRHYTSPSTVPKHFSFDTVWKKRSWASNVQRKAS